MTTRPADTELGILTMLQRYEVMTMDGILTVGQPYFSRDEVFLAIARLRRPNLISLHRVGLSYQISLRMSLMDQAWPLGHEQHHEDPAVQHR